MDDECFKWAVTIAIYRPNVHPERVNKKLRANSENLNLEGIKFPTPLDHISIFEKNNPAYAVFVFGYEGGLIRPLRPSKNYEGKVIIDLLLICNEETNRYCRINDINKLYFSQASKYEGNTCRRCLNAFHSKESLNKHLELCSKHEAVLVEMPVNEDGTPQHMQYKSIHKQMEHPFVVYADFECFTENLDTCTPNPNKSFTKQYQKHTPSGFGYVIKCFDDKLYPPMFIRYTAESPDEDVAQMFADSLEAYIKYIC